jgi:hypothetical protein
MIDCSSDKITLQNCNKPTDEMIEQTVKIVIVNDPQRIKKSLSYKQQTSKQYFRNTATKSCFFSYALEEWFFASYYVIVVSLRVT